MTVKHPFSLNLDEPFQQNTTIDQFLNAPYIGPIQEAKMHRLMSLVHQAIQQELERVGSELRYLSLQLGYDLVENTNSFSTARDSDRTEVVESHCVNLGCQVLNQLDLRQTEATFEEENSTNISELNTAENFLSPAFVDKLLNRIEEVSVVNESTAKFWLFGYADKESSISSSDKIAFASSTSTCCKSTGRHRGQGTTECTGPSCDSPRPPE